MCEDLKFVFDCVVLTETWCKDNLIKLFQLPHYTAHSFLHPRLQKEVAFVFLMKILYLHFHVTLMVMVPLLSLER